MSSYLRDHHQLIRTALENFNYYFFRENRIIFGGGTRIALELNEYRESIDIDFLCPDKLSFRAVRLETTEKSLGNLVKEDFYYPREIRADRDAVRCFIEIENTPIKLEFVSFADYNLQIDPTNPFKVPALSRSSCYLTKLLANADRYANSPYKDIFDILAMFSHWGEIPNDAWDEADTHYGKALVFKNLKKSCEHINAHASEYLEIATNQLDINPAYAKHLLQVTNQEFLHYLNDLEKILLNTSTPQRTFL